MAAEAREERVALAAFAAGTVLAGANAVCIRYSNRELDPLFGAGLRFGLAAAVLLLAMAALRLAFPRGRALTGTLLFGGFTFGGAFALAYLGLVHLHAGIGQTLLGLVPLATLLVAVAAGQERLRPAAVAGGLLALAGVAVISGASLDEDVPALAVLECVGGAFCFALGAVIVRRFPPVHPVTMNAVGMGAGALLLLLGALIAGESFESPDRAATRTAIAYLVVVGSVVVFVLYLVVLRRWAASRVSYEFVLIPVVTVALSAWLDDERIDAGLLVGAPLVLAGVYVGALRGAPDDHGQPAEP